MIPRKMRGPRVRSRGEYSCNRYYKKWVLPYLFFSFVATMASVYLLFGKDIFEQSYFAILPHSIAIVLHANYLRYTYDDTRPHPKPCLFSKAMIDFRTNKLYAGSDARGIQQQKNSRQLCTDSTSLMFVYKGKTNDSLPLQTCRGRFHGRFYLLGDKGRLPNKCMTNFFHYFVEYVTVIHVSLYESQIDRGNTRSPIRILLGHNDKHVLPSQTFRPLLAAVLGFPNIYSATVKQMYHKPAADNLCMEELVVGWPTSKIWFHRPNQAKIMMNDKFSLKLQSLRYLLWRRFLYANEPQNLVEKAISQSGCPKSINFYWWSRSNRERSVKNRGEMLPILKKMLLKHLPFASLEVVDPTMMSIKEQFLHIAKADVLIGSHGAGLSWVLAMRRNATLIELVPSLHFKIELYRNLALMTDLNHKYFHITCTSSPDKQPASSATRGIFGNYGPETHKNDKLHCSANSIFKTMMKAYTGMCVDKGDTIGS